MASFFKPSTFRLLASKPAPLKNFYPVARWASTAIPNPPIELKTTSAAPKDFINTNDLFKNRKVSFLFSFANLCQVLLVGIVGAFTGVCDNQVYFSARLF
jgi:hypothetical protein